MQESPYISCFTKITIAGVGSFPALSAGWRSTATLGSSIHLTGLGDGCYQVLIVCVSPAPPADLRLAATGDHCPVLLVPEIKVLESVKTNTGLNIKENANL